MLYITLLYNIILSGFEPLVNPNDLNMTEQVRNKSGYAVYDGILGYYKLFEMSNTAVFFIFPDFKYYELIKEDGLHLLHPLN